MPLANLGEARLHYELTGPETRPTLVFSNSLGTDFSMWDPQMPAHSQRFRILRYDKRGHGQSSVPPGDYTIEQLGRDVIALLDSLGIDRVHFCGLSIGGMTGMWLAVHAPERLARLVLCNTAARIGTNETWNGRIAAVRKGGMKDVAAAVIERWFTPEFRAASPEKVAPALAMLENANPVGYTGCCAAIRDMDQRDAISAIKVPTLVIYGAKDPVIPTADALFVAERIRGAQTLALDAAHLSNVERAEAFTQGVADFLS